METFGIRHVQGKASSRLHLRTRHVYRAPKNVGRRYAAERLPGGIRTQAMERMQWHRSQGDAVVIVSASLDAYLSPWCERIGVDLICTELEQRDDRLTGGYRHGDCSGPAKARRIVERYDLSCYPIIYAYGDTSEDREMLELAHRRFYRWREIQDWTEAMAMHATPESAR